MKKTTIACVGGFLGAGKTTALQAAATEFGRRGMKVAVITNDQGDSLVDTRAMLERGLNAAEITGGCFCCKFDELLATVNTVVDHRRPDIILAEAVGSCTDLSATVYQPIKQYHHDKFSLAPLSILIEAPRALAVMSGGSSDFPDSVNYLIGKQLAEADLVILSKLDKITSDQRQDIEEWLRHTYEAPVCAISAPTNLGVAQWIDRLLSGAAAGTKLLDIDYDVYAAAEATLGWLNATVVVDGKSAFSPAEFATQFMNRVVNYASQAGLTIAHLKTFVEAGAESDRIAVTEPRSEPRWNGPANFAPVKRMLLIVNARVCADPERLSMLIRDALQTTANAFALDTSVPHLESFSPSRPTPRHRFAEIAS